MKYLPRLDLPRPALPRLVWLLAFCALGLSTPAFAFNSVSSFVVTKTADTSDGTCDADCSLREAITAANANADQSNITFSPTVFNTKKTITAGSALPDLSTPITITGSTSGVTLTSSTPTFSLFSVSSGVSAGFDKLTLTGNSTGINNSGTVTVTNSTLSANGRGVDNSGTLIVTNCTFNGVNSLGINTQGINNAGTATITNCTISGNGYGIINNGTASLKNSIVTNNANGNTPGIFVISADNFVGGDAKLGPLQDNGGPTFTMALLANSPAINPDTSSGAPATDQRGVARVSTPDIGAYESNVVATKQTGPDFVVTNTSDAGDGTCDIAGAGDGCTLREAMTAANANADTSKITFASGVSGNIQLGGELPTLTTAVTITGPVAAGVTVIGADAQFGVSFRVNAGGNATLVNLTIKSSGGAIMNFGTVTVTNCTLSNNGTSITNNGTLTAINSTITSSNNGIYNTNAATITNCTIVGNNNFAFIYQTGTVNFKNSIVSGTIDGNALTDNGNNLINVDAKLGPLQDNGGPTRTMLPASDSPAINAGTATGAPSTDQRGVLRPQGAAYDIGAVESLGALESGSLVVSTTDDLDDGNYSANHNSLREAIKFANAIPDASAITFDPTVFNTAKTITLGSSLPDVSTLVTVTGPAAGVTLDGVSKSFTIFNVTANGKATLSGLTITNGSNGVVNSGSVTLANCTISGSRYNGIYTYIYSQTTITNCTFSGNDFAISNYDTVTVTNCTITGTTYGIFNYGGVTATNCTISGTQTAIFSYGAVTAINCTISGNSSGISNVGGTLTLKNSIVAGNTTNTTGTFTDAGNNIATGTAADAGLDPNGLQDNGGPTKTIALLSTSPALNAGTSTGAPATDQRGLPRAGNVDIGAYELQNTPPTLLDVAVSTNEDTSYTFSAAAFDAKFSDAQSDTLQKVKILLLPSNGVLKLNNVAVTINQEIARANLSTLVYTPIANYNGSDSFGYNAFDGIAYAATGKSVNITINAVNDAPTATNLSAAQSYTEDTTLDLTDIVVSDIDSANVTATLTLSNPAAGSLTTATSGVVTSTYAAATGVWTASGAIADVNTLLAGVSFVPAANFNANFTIATSVSDGVASPLTGSKAITGIAVNDAPVLDNAGTMNLAAINEDDVNNAGSKVADIISSAGGDRITDVDANATEGIAVIAADTSNGSWQYSLDGGANWNALGAVSNTNARLLNSDANTRVRFVPSSNFNGVVNPAITFRAWDRTAGASGSAADASTNGGATAFSTATETASLVVNGINDAPVLNPIANQFVISGNTFSLAASATDPDGPSTPLTYSLVNAPAGATINPQTGVITWKPPFLFGNGTQAYSFTVRASDGGNPPLQDQKTFSVTVLSGLLFSVTTSSNNQGVTLVYHLQNGMPGKISPITVIGTLLQTPLSVTASHGVVTIGKILNPRSSARSVTWNGFALNSTEEATLTLTFSPVAPRTVLAGVWSVSGVYKNVSMLAATQPASAP